MIGLSIVNGAPAAENVHPDLWKLCDIFCVNEIEVSSNYQIIKINFF